MLKSSVMHSIWRRLQAPIAACSIKPCPNLLQAHTSPNSPQEKQIRRASSVELSSSHHKDHVTRGPFAQVTDQDIDTLKGMVDGRVVTDQAELEPYNTDWLKTVRGQSKVLLRPKTTEEVSRIVKYCSDHVIAICPQGGNTGLVGGNVPVFDEVIVSTQLMNQIISLDSLSGALTCQAGCVQENLIQYLSEFGLTVPVNLSSKGSCHIGGNLATNAGGIHLLKHGSLHGSVLGIEAVLPNGEILDCLSTLRKDNTGYDLKQLFIGSEGTLGIITKVSILCPQLPRAVNVAFLGCESFSKVLDTLRSCKSELGEVLSAFEFIDDQTLSVIKEHLKLSCPLPVYPFYVLVEVSGSNGQHDEEKLMSLVKNLLDRGEAADGTIATDSVKIRKLWELRERQGEAIMHDGYCYMYDVSLPYPAFYKLVEVMRERLKDKVLRVVSCGHVGDGNLHLNISTKEYSSATTALIEPFIFDWVAEHQGSISAEHGLGFMKREYIDRSKSPSAIALMKSIKKNIDPKGIMNPYKVLPDF